MSEASELERGIAEKVERDGFAILPAAVDRAVLDRLGAAASRVSGARADGVYERGRLYGIRNLFDHLPQAEDLLEMESLRGAVGAALGPEAFCVRGLFLDNPPRPRWSVAWHQDAVVTVKARAEVTGFGPWAVKGGVQHVMAPPGTLSAMLAVRVPLDDCEDSGSVFRVVPGSHQYGRLPEDSIESFTRYDVSSCAVSRGDLLVIKPLILHRSQAAAAERPSRVVQLDFASRRLPLPLQWREARPLFEARG